MHTTTGIISNWGSPLGLGRGHAEGRDQHKVLLTHPVWQKSNLHESVRIKGALNNHMKSYAMQVDHIRDTL